MEFAVGDVTALHEPDGAYDKVIVTRVIINLANWKNQMKGLRECARVLKPGGTLLLSEATMQGWRAAKQISERMGVARYPHATLQPLYGPAEGSGCPV